MTPPRELRGFALMLDPPQAKLIECLLAEERELFDTLGRRGATSTPESRAYSADLDTLIERVEYIVERYAEARK